MNSLNKSILLVGVILANLPGLGMITNNLFLLPGDSRPLYVGIQTALNSLILMIIWFKKESLWEIEKTKILRISVMAFIGFVTVICLYIFLFGLFVVHENVFPFFPENTLRTALIRCGSPSNVVNEYREGIGTLLETSRITIIITKILFLLLYLLAMGLLVISFSIIGICINRLQNSANNDNN